MILRPHVHHLSINNKTHLTPQPPPTNSSLSTKANTMKLSGLPLPAPLFLILIFTFSPIHVNGKQATFPFDSFHVNNH